MIPVMCILQEGQIAADTEAALKSEIGAFVLRAFGGPADIDWVVVAAGNGFTGAMPSNAIVVSLRASRSLAQGERVPLLETLNEICTSITGLSANNVVTAIRDPR